MRDQQIACLLLFPKLIQEIINPLCDPHHGFSAAKAIDKVLLGALKAFAVPGCALPLAEVLLPESHIHRKRQFQYIRNLLCGIPRAA